LFDGFTVSDGFAEDGPSFSFVVQGRSSHGDVKYGAGDMQETALCSSCVRL
jgi:hypothetical protein